MGKIEINKIYHMNCLEGMKLIGDKSVDLIITDPPYNVDIVGITYISKMIKVNNIQDTQNIKDFADKRSQRAKAILHYDKNY